MRWRTTLAVMRKEVRHITRDRMTFGLTLLSPLLILIVFGYSFLVEVKDVPTAVVDYDQSSDSRAFLAKLGEGNTLVFDQYPTDQQAAERLIKDGIAEIALIIPDDFGHKVASRTGLPFTVLVDGSEPHAANEAMVHIIDQTKEYIKDETDKEGAPPLVAPVELTREALYDIEDIEFINGTMPGIIGVALSFAGVAVCAALTREKELGTFEGLVATPIRRSELLIGKLIPYVGTGLVTVLLCALAAVYGFGVPFRGSVVSLILLSLIFLFALMGYAMLLSLFFRTQQAAMLTTMLFFMIPPFFVSGIFVPIIVMPVVVQIEAMMIPTTPFVIIMRGLFLRGYGLPQLWLETLVLIGCGVSAMVLTVILFRKRLQTGWLDWMLTNVPMPAAERRLLERLLYR